MVLALVAGGLYYMFKVKGGAGRKSEQKSEPPDELTSRPAWQQGESGPAWPQAAQSEKKEPEQPSHGVPAPVLAVLALVAFSLKNEITDSFTAERAFTLCGILSSSFVVSHGGGFARAALAAVVCIFLLPAIAIRAAA